MQAKLETDAQKSELNEHWFQGKRLGNSKHCHRRIDRGTKMFLDWNGGLFGSRFGWCHVILTGEIADYLFQVMCTFDCSPVSLVYILSANLSTEMARRPPRQSKTERQSYYLPIEDAWCLWINFRSFFEVHSDSNSACAKNYGNIVLFRAHLSTKMFWKLDVFFFLSG